MTDSRELRRLRSGPEPGERPGGIDSFVARCPGNAEAVLGRAREVMEVVLRFGTENWPPDSEWPSLLPAWFVAACGPETSVEEDERYMESWRRLSREEQIEEARRRSWSLLNWVFWMHPDERPWSWWHASVNGPNELLVSIEVDGWPFPWESLSWLLRASGAEDVDEKPVA
jgi:hypothetical protein